MRNVRTSQFFHRYAKGFTDIYGTEHTGLRRFINKYLRGSMMLRFQKTLQICTPIEGKTFLDVGCGPGHYGVVLAELGAASVLGIDFAEGMLDIARRNAAHALVLDRCRFQQADFLTFEHPEKFDFVILMGFMDYMADPKTVINKALSLTHSRALFSFPVRHGFLDWQRRLRYRWKCDLYMFDREQLVRLFSDAACEHYSIERIARDYFVTADI